MKTLILTAVLTIVCFCQTISILPQGDLIEGFENLDEWVASGISVSNATDAVHYTEGANAIRLGTLENQRAYMTKRVSLNLKNYEVFSIDLFVPDYSSDYRRYIRIELSSTPDFSKYLRINIYAGEKLYLGWNRLLFSKSDFIEYAGPEDWSKIIRMRISEWMNYNNIIAANITLDNLRGYKLRPTPIAIITFDDNWRSTVDLGKPILDSLGFKAVQFVTGKNALGNHSSRLQWPAYDSLYSEGWDLGNHTYNHRDLNTVSTDSLDYEINGMRDTLIKRGYTRSCDFFAYPYGEVSEEIINKVKEKHKLARCTKEWQYMPHPTLGDSYYLLRKHSENETYEQTRADIDAAISRGQLMVFLFHDISPIIQKFSSIMKYLKHKQDEGLIRVMTMSEYWKYLKPNSETTEEKSQSNVNFVLDQNYPNPFNSSTTINYRIAHFGFVQLIIYNTLGERIASLENAFRGPGTYSVKFNASNIPGGIYFYRLECSNYNQTRKMLLLK